MLPEQAVLNVPQNPKEIVKEKSLENNEKLLSEWQTPKNKTGFIIFLVSSLFFLIFGIVFLVLNQQIYEISARYDNYPGCNSSQILNTCDLKITIDEAVKPPIFFYYELNNYFQNHRVYLESRDDEQLAGKWKEVNELDGCYPVKTNKQLKPNLTVRGVVFKEDGPATPCGLIAKTFFSDTYELWKGDQRIPIDEKNISWKYDRDNFKNTEHLDKQWMDHTNEHFQVWMRAAGLSKFRKLWGRINQELVKGDYTIKIHNNYDEKIFDAKKLVVLTTINALGGKNTVLVLSYMITGGICLLLTIVFLIGWIREKKRKIN